MGLFTNMQVGGGRGVPFFGPGDGFFTVLSFQKTKARVGNADVYILDTECIASDPNATFKPGDKRRYRVVPSEFKYESNAGEFAQAIAAAAGIRLPQIHSLEDFAADTGKEKEVAKFSEKEKIRDAETAELVNEVLETTLSALTAGEGDAAAGNVVFVNARPWKKNPNNATPHFDTLAPGQISEDRKALLPAVLDSIRAEGWDVAEETS